MGKITVYLEDDEVEQFKANTAADDRTMTAVVRRWIREYNHRASDSSTVGAQPTERTP